MTGIFNRFLCLEFDVFAVLRLNATLEGFFTVLIVSNSIFCVTEILVKDIG
jgi:hypothetical protein